MALSQVNGSFSAAPVPWSKAPVADEPWPSYPMASSMARLMSTWRAAERRLEELIEASPMRISMLAQIAEARSEYQRLFMLAIR